jgi:uncharacterized membrane protein YeaQ/YmgE (transglycosylase-associated protein family)
MHRPAVSVLDVVLSGAADFSTTTTENYLLGAMVAPDVSGEDRKMGIIWTIIIGFVAGLIAKFIMPGPNEPSGFIMTTILGIIGAVVANFLGQSLGWYGPGQGAGLIGAVVGAIIVLFVWGAISRRRAY